MFGRIVTSRLAGAGPLQPPGGLSPDSAFDLDSIVDEAASRSFEHYCNYAQTLSPDGIPINVYAAGDPNRKAVVIASVCGMPARLSEPWIRRPGSSIGVTSRNQTNDHSNGHAHAAKAVLQRMISERRRPNSGNPA